MIYRNDDLPQDIPLFRLRDIHEEFVKRNKTHTMCIVASQLASRPDFVDWVNGVDHKDLILHGWNHVAYAELPEDQIRLHLVWSLRAFDQAFKILPTQWHPPWNGWTKELGFDGVPRLKQIAKDYGLDVYEKAKDIRNVVNGNIKADVVYFHSWEEKEYKLVPNLLDMEE